MDYDIIIIGGGPAGLSFAGCLADTELRIAIIEKNARESLQNPAYDGREIALTHHSQKIMNDFSMWDNLSDNDISRIKTAKVMNGDSPYALSFDYEESGEEFLGFMVSNSKIRKAVYESMQGFENIDLICETEVETVGTDNDKGWVKLKNGDRLEASLIVAADSRFSASRKMMDVPCDMLNFERTCIVSTMKIEKPHDYTAYECFHFDRTLAVLPLNNDCVSVVITLPTSEADALIAMSKEDFNKDMEKRTEGRFGAMESNNDLYPYPLVATLAQDFYSNRFALIGDAAVGMHPVTAHGFNLGLRGANTLAELIREAVQSDRDFASDVVLKEYSRKHRRAVLPLYHGTNMLVKLYTKTTPVAKLARRGLLRLGSILPPARRMIINQLTETAV